MGPEGALRFGSFGLIDCGLWTAMTVKLKFQPPNRKDSGERAHVHDPTLEEVPMREAWQMALDFDRYNRNDTRRHRHKSYCYLRGGEEIEVGLDFEEIISLEMRCDREEEGASKMEG